MVYRFRFLLGSAISISICQIVLASSFNLHFSQIGTSLTSPNKEGIGWASIGDQLLPVNISAKLKRAESVHLAYPLSGWSQEHNTSGWKASEWLGAYKTYPDSWIYHAAMGWVYIQQNAIDSIWIWQEEIGWVWTNSSVFPCLFQENPKGWLSLDPASSYPTLVYDFSNLVWFELGRPWKSISLIADPTAGGTISAPTRFRKGDDLSIVAKPNSGYVFTGWDGDHDGNQNPLVLNKENRNLKLTAHFTPLSESISQGINSPTFDHLQTNELKKQAQLELALFGKSDLISTGQSETFQFSTGGNKETKLLVALGMESSNNLVGVFEQGSSVLTHPLFSWQAGDNKAVDLDGENRGIVQVKVLDNEVARGVECTVLELTYPDMQVEKKWLAQDNLENIWLVESTLNNQPLQHKPTFLLPNILEKEWQSWSPMFAVPLDHSIILDYPKSIRTQNYGLVDESVTLYLERKNRPGQSESYAPGLGLIQVSIP